jgi:AcrR family transcriptional regulator
MTPPPDTSTNGASPTPKGRPRDPERSRAIRDAARSLLHEGGWDALTIEAVAARAQVGRPTVYRRWPTKGHLAAEVLQHEHAEAQRRDDASAPPLPDHGSLADDLRSLLAELLAALDDLEARGVQPGVVAEMVLDGSLAERVRIDGLLPHRKRVAMVVHRAVERGEARPDLDPDFVVDTLAGVVMFRRYVLHEPVGDDEQKLLVELVTQGCRR